MEVWERDGGKCVICECSNGAFPNAHYIPRSQGGLGIAQNIVTLCGNFTENKCHHMFDNGGKREEYGEKIKKYLQSKYPDWDEKKLYFRKGAEL